MLKSYSAEIDGSRLIWIDTPPPNLKRQPVLVVIENTAAASTSNFSNSYDLTDLAGRLAWQGDALAYQRAQRDAW